VAYFDEENETSEKMVMNLTPDTVVPGLHKYATKLELEGLA
jgi:hypothetical protein